MWSFYFTHVIYLKSELLYALSTYVTLFYPDKNLPFMRSWLIVPNSNAMLTIKTKINHKLLHIYIQTKMVSKI